MCVVFKRWWLLFWCHFCFFLCTANNLIFVCFDFCNVDVFVDKNASFKGYILCSGWMKRMNNFVPGYSGYHGIRVTRQQQFCCIFAARKDKFGYFLKKLLHSSTLHTYHHNSSLFFSRHKNICGWRGEGAFGNYWERFVVVLCGLLWGENLAGYFGENQFFLLLTYCRFLRYWCDLAIENLGMPQMLDL